MTAASNPHIVAHELAHVVQQHTGQTAGLAGAGGKAERRRLEQQAESAARDVLGRAG
jgi:Zn-dependent peptidase ImmA (M78 family)